MDRTQIVKLKRSAAMGGSFMDYRLRSDAGV